MYRSKAKKKVPIKYTSRDFDSIKRDLIELAKRNYASTYQDFNEASFGSFMLDTVAYIGDMLSFYLDYQVNESFLDTAIEYDNIIKLGKERGYKYRGSQSSYGTATFYIIVPASNNKLGPNTNYIPILSKGSYFSTPSGINFILNENVDFSHSDNEIVVAKVNDTSGAPTHFAIKASGRIVSGEIIQEDIKVGAYQRFLRVPLSGRNITEILSVYDGDGYEYSEVDYLSQNIIYKTILNRGSNKEQAPSILKPIIVPRRFVFEQDRDDAYLQFGYGSSEDIKINNVADPSNVILNIHGKDYVTDSSFDPAKLMETDKFGVAPVNTTLRVVYRKNTANIVNAGAGSVTEIVDPSFQFENANQLNETLMLDVMNTLEVTNEQPILGDISLPGTEELKRRIIDSSASQNRAVTAQDYISTVYQMPSEFGSVKRCNVVVDADSFKRNLNLYVISENENGTLIQTNSQIKNNLKIWLEKNKMINDSIDILDAKQICLGIEYEIVSEEEENKYDVLARAGAILKEYYNIHMDIGESFSISNIYKTLNTVDGILDVLGVRIVKITGTNYEDSGFDIDSYLSSDGLTIYAPLNAIFSIRYPGVDIVGSVR